MNHQHIRSCGLLLASALSLHCGDGEDGANTGVQTPIRLDFALEVGGQPFECGAAYPGIGDPGAEFTVTDARFYVHDVELLDTAGTAHPVALDEGAFQGDGIALLDFEDGCGPDGTSETNTAITATVAAGDYRSVRFTLGVPPEQNFIDLAAAKAPLDVTGMFWTWQYGYKFFKLDGSSPAEGGGINPFFIHLGSSDCPGDNPQAPPSAACDAPNRVTYELAGFTEGETTIVAEVADILATTDLSFNTEGTAPGCMSETNDPECQAVLPRMGVDDANDQLLFSTD